MLFRVKPVVWFAAPSLSAASDRIVGGGLTSGAPGLVVSSLDEFSRAVSEPDVIAFIDEGVFDEIARLDKIPSALIAVCTESLPGTIKWLHHYPWLGHVTNTAMLEHPLARTHFSNVASIIWSNKPRLLDWVGTEVEGRRVRLTHASRRAERLERMGDYLSSLGVSARTIVQARDAAEELLTNAFYDAPVAAGLFDGPISREVDVELPEDAACDLGYGALDDLVVVRVKDPFGSLTRSRLVEVLLRCARTDMQVEVDESMGGAGLGVWRVFSAAAYVAISVTKGSSTEILVGFTKRATPRPFAIDLFFRPKAGKQYLWTLPHGETMSQKSVLLKLDPKTQPE
jgi:hypothetical protein